MEWTTNIVQRALHYIEMRCPCRSPFNSIHGRIATTLSSRARIQDQITNWPARQPEALVNRVDCSASWHTLFLAIASLSLLPPESADGALQALQALLHRSLFIVLLYPPVNASILFLSATPDFLNTNMTIPASWWWLMMQWSDPLRYYFHSLFSQGF